MQISSREGSGMSYTLTLVKSFSVWNITLLVCLLVVGFPIVAIMATIGVLATVTLQSVLPLSSVLVVTSSLLGGTLLSIIGSSALLTLRGIHPHEVSWLGWLNEEPQHLHKPTFASCPLTCDLVP